MCKSTVYMRLVNGLPILQPSLSYPVSGLTFILILLLCCFAYLHYRRYKTVWKRFRISVLRCENYHYIILVWAVLASLGTEQLSFCVQHGEIGTVAPRDILHPIDNRFQVDLIHVLQAHYEIGCVTIDDDSKMNVREMSIDRNDQL